jgi:hypothetical protein
MSNKKYNPGEENTLDAILNRLEELETENALLRAQHGEPAKPSNPPSVAAIAADVAEGTITAQAGVKAARAVIDGQTNWTEVARDVKAGRKVALATPSGPTGWTKKALEAKSKK